MNYKIYKLKFQSPVHFGSDILGTSLEEADLICHSDTLFSALCLEYIKLNGSDNLDNNFIDLFRKGDLLISSLFPYKKDKLYVPKPFLVRNKNNNDAKENNLEDNKYDRKAMKKISYLKIDDMSCYLESLNKGNNSFLEKIDKEKGYNDFAEYSLIQKVSLRSNRDNKDNDDDNNDLYSVGGYSFYNDCGLYFILAYMNDENLKLFETILKSLQYSGIGGKRTSGYGLFNYEVIKDDSIIKIFKFEDENKDNYKMLLSLYYPIIDELNNIELRESYYSLIKRSGFIYSLTYSDNLLKRKSLCMFKEGSCFMLKKESENTSFKGDIINVSNNGSHEVYRYGKVLYIGLN